MQKPKRIGIDARLIQETGVGRYIRNLLTYLARFDETNEYVVFVQSKDYEQVILPNDRWHVRKADVRWHTVMEQIMMPILFYQEHLDVVHIPYFNAPIFYVGRFILTIHDLTILAVHTGKASTLPGWLYGLKRLAYRLVLSWGLARASHIIAVSNTVKNEIIKKYSVLPQRITVTYEGIDELFTNTRGSMRQKRAAVPGTYFLYVGNVYPHKNIDVLLEAFLILLKKQEKPIRLVFVGPEDYFYRQLRLTIRSLGIADSVSIYHAVDDTTLLDIYRHAIALVFPSRMEGFGLPAIEALSVGCPVIVSDIPIFREILGDSAQYVDTTRADTVSDAMDRMCQQNRNMVPLTVRRQILKKYDWSQMTKQTIGIYGLIG